MAGKQKFAELVNLRDKAGHYKRIKLASELIADKTWVEDPSGGGGDVNIALDRIEEGAFADLCGAVTISQLLEVYHHIPDEQVWKRHGYNFRKMWAEWNSSRKPAPKPASNGTTRQHTAQQTAVPPEQFNLLEEKEMKQQYKRAARTVETLEAKVETAEEKIARLEEEVRRKDETIAGLRREVSTLQRRLVVWEKAAEAARAG